MQLLREKLCHELCQLCRTPQESTSKYGPSARTMSSLLGVPRNTVSLPQRKVYTGLKGYSMNGDRDSLDTAVDITTSQVASYDEPKEKDQPGQVQRQHLHLVMSCR